MSKHFVFSFLYFLFFLVSNRSVVFCNALKRYFFSRNILVNISVKAKCLGCFDDVVDALFVSFGNF